MERKSYRAPQYRQQAEQPAPKKQEQGGSKFIYITGFFPSKSGKADTVFVTDEILEKLHTLKVGDLLSLSAQKNGNIGMSYLPKEGE